MSKSIAPASSLVETILGLPFDFKITGPLLVALLYYPQKLQSILPATLHQHVVSQRLIRILKVFVAFGLIRYVNRYLSRRAINNFQKDARFVNSQELVLITGGSGGIGELIIKDFSKRGVKVINLDLNPPKTPQPSNVHFYPLDITDFSEVISTAAKIRSTHGDPTVLINNAGIADLSNSVLSSSEAHIRKTFEVNSIALFWTVKAFVPAMIEKNRGHIVTVASMASYITPAHLGHYCASKAAALSFHESLALELVAVHNAPNIKTSTIHPSWVRTQMTAAFAANSEWKEPTIEPEQVSAAIVHQVVSGSSGHIVGSSVASTIRAWPVWAQLLVRKSMGSVLLPFASAESKAGPRYTQH